LAGGYDLFKSPKSSPLCASDYLPIHFPMDSIRKLVKLEATKRTALREVDQDHFWNDLVNDTSLGAYFTRQAGVHAAASAFDPHSLDIFCATNTSIGDLNRLNLLNAYLPSATRKTLTVEDVVLSTRNSGPMFTTVCYQYNGQLALHFCMADDFATAKSLRHVADIFEEWTMAVI
ncbi:hypothetical protein DFH11DRAFT_1505398, partial [Phellopilus nigrolimitatus]